MWNVEQFHFDATTSEPVQILDSLLDSLIPCRIPIYIVRHGSGREQKLPLAVHQPPASGHAKVLDSLGVVILDTSRLLEQVVYTFSAGVSSVECDRFAGQHEHACEHRVQLGGIEEAKGAKADDVIDLARSLDVIDCVT